MKADEQDPVLPPNDAPFLTDWLFDIGPTSQDGPIGWQDMTAWTELSGVDLTPWEASTIRRLSKAYVAQRSEARKPNCPEPRLQADEVAARKRVDAQFAAMVGVLKA